jgi:hypothetical protein
MSSQTRTRKRSQSLLRKSYTINFKRAVILFHKQSDPQIISKTAKEFNLKSRATVREWLKDSEAINDPAMRVNSRRLISLASKKFALFPDSENRVYNWFLAEKSEFKKVEGLTIREEMIKDVKANHPDVIILVSIYF